MHTIALACAACGTTCMYNALHVVPHACTCTVYMPQGLLRCMGAETYLVTVYMLPPPPHSQTTDRSRSVYWYRAPKHWSIMFVYSTWGCTCMYVDGPPPPTSVD